jgi:hypothetical protein
MAVHLRTWGTRSIMIACITDRTSDAIIARIPHFGDCITLSSSKVALVVVASVFFGSAVFQAFASI